MASGFVHRFSGERGQGPFLHPGTTLQSRRDDALRACVSPLQFFADTLLISALSTLAGVVYHVMVGKTFESVVPFTFIGLTVAFLFAGFERLLAGRRGLTLRTWFDRFREVSQSWTLAFAALFFVLFALKADGDLSRGAVLSFYVICLPIIAIWRELSVPVIAKLARKAGYGDRGCIVVGTINDPRVSEFISELLASGFPRPRVIKYRADCPAEEWPTEQKRVITSIVNAARTTSHGEIFLCADAAAFDRQIAMQRALSILPRAVYIVPEAQTASLVRCRPAPIGSHIAVEVQREPLGFVERLIKRAMDITISLALLAFLLPALIIISILIKLDSNGPVLFRQTRNGYRGRPFRIFKFRTMHVQEDGDDVRQASRGDSRVTRIGRFLRSSSIDEIPQLLNVLLGDMSLVGPRPHAQAHDTFYGAAIENYEVRQHVKPGITGWAQVNGLRGETRDLELMYRRIEFDLWYAVNASLMFDLEILVRTGLEVFRRRNAY